MYLKHKKVDASFNKSGQWMKNLMEPIAKELKHLHYGILKQKICCANLHQKPKYNSEILPK